MTATYVPGTLETDQKKLIYSLQQLGPKVDTLNAATYVNSIGGRTGVITLNSTSGITNSSNDIILSQGSTSQFGAVKVDGTTITASSGVISVGQPALTKITASLGADVLLNNTANYFDGPSIAQGTSGIWWVSGTVTVIDPAGVATFVAKLWDGTTVIATTAIDVLGTNKLAPISLSGFISSPAANIRISCRDLSSTSGKIVFNASTLSKDSTLSAIRIG